MEKGSAQLRITASDSSTVERVTRQLNIVFNIASLSRVKAGFNDDGKSQFVRFLTVVPVEVQEPPQQ